MSLWSGCENLATVTENVVGEQIEELIDEVDDPGWKIGGDGIRRLNSEGDEFEEVTNVDQAQSTCLTGIVREEELFLVGVEYQDEYFDSLSGSYWSDEQHCAFCKVRNISFYFESPL